MLSEPDPTRAALSWCPRNKCPKGPTPHAARPYSVLTSASPSAGESSLSPPPPLRGRAHSLRLVPRGRGQQSSVVLWRRFYLVQLCVTVW